MLPMKPLGSPSASSDLGLGDLLSQQVAGETEEQRKKRMAQQQQQSRIGSLAVTSLFGAGAASA